jgi:hypothetical protein
MDKSSLSISSFRLLGWAEEFFQAPEGYLEKMAFFAKDQRSNFMN